MPIFEIGITLKEGRFRQLWNQKADEHTVRQISLNIEERNKYEVSIFRNIIEMIQGGVIELQTNGRKKYVKKEKTELDEVAITKRQKKRLQALRQEVKRISSNMHEDIQYIKSQANAERARMQPGWMASHAIRLEKGFMELQTALKRDLGGLEA